MGYIAFTVFSGCSLILMVGYMKFMENVLPYIFVENSDSSIVLQLFVMVMFPATFFMFMIIGFLTYYFIWRAFKVYMEFKWAVVLILLLTTVLIWDTSRLLFL